MTQQFHSWVFIQEKKVIKKDTHTSMVAFTVHSSIIYNYQDMEAT